MRRLFNAACRSNVQKVRWISFPWESRLPPEDDRKWTKLGKDIVDKAVASDTGRIAFEECQACRDQLEAVIHSLGYDINVFIFGGLVTMGFLEIGGDIDFVGVGDVEPTFDESGEIVGRVSRELKKMGLRSWALPKARIPVMKVDRTSKSFPGTPFHQLSRDGVFHFARPLSADETKAFEQLLYKDFRPSQVDWEASNQYAIAQFSSTSELICALSTLQRVGSVDIPIRLPIDPKCGPELFRFPFDFCLSPTGLRNSYLFSKALREYDCARHLLIVLKKWGRSSGVINSFDGLLASYAMTVMLVHFLVKVGVIPLTQPQAVNELNSLQMTPEYRPLCETATNYNEVGYLLGGFFEYYGCVFDYSESVVCTSNVNLKKDSVGWNQQDGVRPPYFNFAIKDPYGLDSIGRNLDRESTAYVKEAHHLALTSLLSDLELSSLDTLLHNSRPPRKVRSLSQRGISSETLSPHQMDARHEISKAIFHERKRQMETVGVKAVRNMENHSVASAVTKNVLGWIRSEKN